MCQLLFGTHSLRPTNATPVSRRNGNPRAVQLLLGHTKIESTVRYLGIEVIPPMTITIRRAATALGPAAALWRVATEASARAYGSGRQSAGAEVLMPWAARSARKSWR